MVRHWSRIGLFRKTFLILAIPTTVPILLLGLASTSITQRQLTREIETKSDGILNQVKLNVEFFFRELHHHSLTFSTNPGLSSRLRRVFQEERIEMTDYTLLSTVMGLLSATTFVRPYVHSLYFYLQNESGRFISTNDGIVRLSSFHDTGWFQSYQHNRPDRDSWSERRSILRSGMAGYPDNVLSIYRTIKYMGQAADVGVIALNVNIDYLIDTLDGLTWHPEQVLLVISKESGFTIGTTNSAEIGPDVLRLLEQTHEQRREIELSDVQYQVSRIESAISDFTFLSLVPRRYFYATSNRLLVVSLLLIAISIFVSIILTARIARVHSQQMLGVLSIISAAEAGEPLPEPSLSKEDEYGYIGHTVLTSFIQNRYLKLQISERKFRMEALELAALQAQMNPHFLFNALNSIRWKVIDAAGGTNRTSDMIENLADILAYSMESPGKVTTFGREIEHTKNYIAIEHERFQDRFCVQWQCQPGIEESASILLLLQPLVENAIRHGVAGCSHYCTVTIAIRAAEDGTVLLEVRDDGAGISADDLDALQTTLTDTTVRRDHIGLVNTCRRLQLAFGEDSCEFRVEGAPGAGFRVTIRIPDEKPVVARSRGHQPHGHPHGHGHGHGAHDDA